MNTGFDVYTPLETRAFKLAQSAGGEVHGPDNHGKDEEKGKKVEPGVYYAHYHPWHRRCHIFFDKPTIVH